MMTFLKTRTGMIVGGIVFLTIGIAIGNNWSTIKGWFTGNGTERQKCRSDNAGCYVMIGTQKEYVDCSACPSATA